MIRPSAIDEERHRFAKTLEEVGPDAPTNAGAWTAHDVRRANGIARDSHPDLDDVIEWLIRYSRLDPAPDGLAHDVAYWLAGREGGPRPI